MTDDERRINLSFNLNDVIYPCENFTKQSIFGCAHTGELKKLKEKCKKERIYLISDIM